MTSMSDSPSKCVAFSYHKHYQALVLKIYHRLKARRLPVWIDCQDGIHGQVYRKYEIAMCKNRSFSTRSCFDGFFSRKDIVENFNIFVCFITPLYQSCKTFQRQVELAESEGIPIMTCRLLPNWKPSGWLSRDFSFLLCFIFVESLFRLTNR